MGPYISSTVSGGSGLGGLYKQPDPILLSVVTWYWYVHPYASLVVCIFGITTNILNIIILNFKNLRSPTNYILSGIAFSDLCLMVCYLPYVINFYIWANIRPTAETYSLGWTTFLVFHCNFTAVLHTATLWLAVYLAVFRYFFLKEKSSRKCFQLRSTYIAIVSIFILSILIMLPNFFMMQIEEHVLPSNESMYRLKDLGIGSPNQDPLVLSTFWIYAGVGKIMPSIGIAIMCGLLLKTLSKVKRLSIGLNSSQDCQRARQYHITTSMIMIIIVLYLITEITQGIMVLISCYAEGFFLNVYVPLGDIMDIIALINNSVNFILYCCMSQRFRELFFEMIPICGATNKRYTQEFELIGKSRMRTRTLGLRHNDCEAMEAI